MRTITDGELRAGHENTVYGVGLMGKDVFIGFMLRAITDGAEQFKAELKSQLKANNGDENLTNQQLWKKFGCNAIYNGLPK